MPDPSAPDTSMPGPSLPAPFAHERALACPGGPLLLRGPHVVRDPDGHEHTTTRPVSAVCRCGHSAVQPWCDGTHKVAKAFEPTEPWHEPVSGAGPVIG